MTTGIFVALFASALIFTSALGATYASERVFTWRWVIWPCAIGAQMAVAVAGIAVADGSVGTAVVVALLLGTAELIVVASTQGALRTKFEELIVDPQTELRPDNRP